MAYRKGKPRPPNSGRKRGTPNKVTKELRDLVLGALEDAGGQKYLAQQAKLEPSAFLSLLGKCLPKDIKVGGGLRLQVNLIGPVRRDS
jgi:hypothetical protein